MEPPLLYLYSLGIVSDETPQERQRSLMPRTRFACVNFAIAMSLSMAVSVSNDARTLHSRRHAVQFAFIFAAHTSAVAVKRNAKM